MSTGETGRHVVGFLYVFVDIFPDFQNYNISLDIVSSRLCSLWASCMVEKMNIKALPIS